MLHSTPRPGLSRDREDALLHAEPDYISFLDISRFVRRNRMLIFGCLAVALALAAFYLTTAQRTFTARAQILIDPNATELVRDTNPGAQGRSLDTAQVEGQIALLRSESLAYSVIGKLKLLDDAEFHAQPPSFFRQLLALAKTVLVLGEPESPVPEASSPEYARQRTALDIFLANLDVRRVGTSYAIDITYTSPDPEKAALIANTAAESYIDDQRKNMSRAAQQSSEWLEARLYQLRSQLNTAARQLELFRAGREIRPLDQRRDVATPPPAAPGTPGAGASDVGARDRGTAAPTQRDTVSRGSVSPPGEITLAELESTTESYRKIYEAYQQAFTEAVQRQSFPVTNTRVITAATKPLGKSSPRSQLIVMFATLVGVLIGVAASVLRESMDNTVRSARQVRTKIGLPCLAVIPRVDRHALLAGAENAMSRLRKGNSGGRPSQAMKGRLSADYNFRVAIDVPFSPFASAMKNLRTAIAHSDPRNPMRCIGITSSMPREGKSMVSGNLATLYALSSGRTLIIDADIHNSTLSRHYAPGVAAGLLEVVTGMAELDRAIVKGTGFVPDILPIAVKETAPVSYEQLASEKMQTLLHVLRERYDMIIVDLPPVHPIVDGVAIGALLDGVVVVAEWGRAPVELVAEVRSTLYTAQVNVLGVVITKADASAATVRWRKDWGYGYYPSARVPRGTPGGKG
jgi:capsular exopolysaccharide synthesis family protein